MSPTELVENLQTVSQSLKFICTQGKVTNISINAALNVLNAFTKLTVDQAIKIPTATKESFLESVSSVYEMYFYYTNTENAIIDEILYPKLSKTKREAIKAARNLTRLNIMNQIMNLTDKITDILVGTAQPTLNPLIVDTKIFRTTLLTNAVSYFQNNNITSSPREAGFFVQVPASAFKVGVNIPSPNVEIRMKMMQYYENPYQFYPDLKFPETDIIQIEFLDANSNKIPIKNTPDPFDIYIPWSEYHQSDLAKEMVTCVWWDTNYAIVTNTTNYITVNSSMYNSSYLASNFNFVPTATRPWTLFSVPNVTYYTTVKPNFNNSGCTFMMSTRTHTICRCNHLTTFASLYNQPNPVPWNKRISDFYITPFSIPWYETLGFYFLITLTGLFVALTVGCWMSELTILNKKLKRMFVAKAKMEKILYNKSMNPEDLIAEAYKPQAQTEQAIDLEDKVSRGKLQKKILLGKEIDSAKPRKASDFDKIDKSKNRIFL